MRAGRQRSQLILMSQSLILSSDSLETDTDSSNSLPSANESLSVYIGPEMIEIPAPAA